MIRTLLIAVLLATGAVAAEDFTPVKAGSVTYPLPPVPLPQATAPAATDGKWAETEDSPALRVSRAWVKLGQAAGVERSEATRRLYVSWKNESAQSGLHSRASQAAHARFLAAYRNDLEAARAIYEGVLREVDAMDSDGSGDSAPQGGPQTSLAREAQDQIAMADRDERLSNSACFLSPETCQQPDPADKALQDEIGNLVKETLEAGGPDGGLSLYSLRRKASLLALRARVMSAITQRTAARLATEVATQQDGQGMPRTLPNPTSPVASAAQARRAVSLSDPYR
ncbi:MAG TPA: hypothetical protein VLW85_07555 [Myxococcales bacterium]|nr:hypothetical protein [Myxococcales bacterium]